MQWKNLVICLGVILQYSVLTMFVNGMTYVAAVLHQVIILHFAINVHRVVGLYNCEQGVSKPC